MEVCVYMGDMKYEDITAEMVVHLYRIFRWMIEKQNVKIFISTSDTDFEHMCESVLLYLKERFFYDIEIQKFAKGLYQRLEDTLGFPEVRNGTVSLHAKRCEILAKFAKYIVFDTLDPEGVSSKVFFKILSKELELMDGYGLLVLDSIAKKYRNEVFPDKEEK